WTFGTVTRAAEGTVPLRAPLSVNDVVGLTTPLLASAGIGDLPPLVQPDLMRDGRLVEVMPKWRFRSQDLSLVHLGNRHTPGPVRLFKEFAARMVPTLFQDLPT